jgi:hypothetical protein
MLSFTMKRSNRVLAGCLFFLLALGWSAAMDVTETDISFSSQLIEVSIVLLYIIDIYSCLIMVDSIRLIYLRSFQTRLILRKDSSRSASQGIGLSVSLSGDGAPSVNPEDVLVKNGGTIEVRPVSREIKQLLAHINLYKTDSSRH